MSELGVKLPLFGGAAPAAAVEQAGQRGASAASISLEMEEAQAERSVVMTLHGGRRMYIQMQLLGIAALLGLLVAVGSVLMYADRSSRVGGAIAVATEMEMLSQRLANSAQQAVLGSEPAFVQLGDSAERFAANMLLLQEGGRRGPTVVAAAPEMGQTILRELGQNWQQAERRVGLILGLKAELIALRQQELTIEAARGRLPGLTQELSVLATEKGEATRIVTLARQMQSDVANFDFANAAQLVSTDNPNPQVALQLAVNVRQFRLALTTVLEGRKETNASAAVHPDVRRKAEQLAEAFQPFAAGVENIVKRMADLAAAKEASR